MLAARAVPRAPSRDARLLDRVAAARARLILAAVDPELGLHRAFASVGAPVVAEGGALALDSAPECSANATNELGELFPGQLVSRPEGMETRPPESLVGVDVPDPGEEALVENERLQGRAAAGDPVGEGTRGERPAERLGTDALCEVGLQLAGLEEQPCSESTHIAVGDVRAVV